MNKRNAEIKAKLRDVESVVARANELCNYKKVMKQHDTFFKVTNGRLKLRKLENGSAELIFYERPDILGPKISTYNKLELNSSDAELLEDSLSKSIGVLGVVKKTRKLFIIGQTRVHIDEVEDLGNFIELEIVLQKDQNELVMVNDLMRMLYISPDDLIAGAYIDLLQQSV